jgi:KDO2-lipid IV(A) lauroyltransferase
MSNDERRMTNHPSPTRYSTFDIRPSFFFAFRALGAISPRIPARWGYAVASGLADLLYARNIQTVRGLRDNIRHAMRPSAATALVNDTARRAHRTLFLGYWDMFRLPTWTVEQLRTIVQVVGWETVEQVRALGRGVLLCSAHLGQFEAGLHIVATNGMPILAPAEHVQPERLYRFLTDLRTRHGVHFIPSDGSMLELFRVLRRNEAVALALDRDTTESGVDVMLCGKLAHVPDGYARIAAKTRTPLITGFCYRLPDGRARIETQAMYLPDPTADRDAVYRAALDFGVRELERAITAHPEQWVLTTPIWIEK